MAGLLHGVLPSSNAGQYMFQPGSSTQYQTAPASSSNGMGSKMGSGSDGGTKGNVESGVNTGLSVGAMVPGPQQPFIMAASMLAPLFEKLF
jgi:hypothetical protein